VKNKQKTLLVSEEKNISGKYEIIFDTTFEPGDGGVL